MFLHRPCRGPRCFIARNSWLFRCCFSYYCFLLSSVFSFFPHLANSQSTNCLSLPHDRLTSSPMQKILPWRVKHSSTQKQPFDYYFCLQYHSERQHQLHVLQGVRLCLCFGHDHSDLHNTRRCGYSMLIEDIFLSRFRDASFLFWVHRILSPHCRQLSPKPSSMHIHSRVTPTRVHSMPFITARL